MRRRSWVTVLDHVVTLVAAGGTFLTLVAGLCVPTMGGRRSTRLKWEERRQEIREAVARAGAEPPAPR